MRICILALWSLAIAITSCQRSPLSSSKAEIEKERFAKNIIRKVATQLKQETDLRPIGTIGQMHYKVQVLGLSFYYYQPIDIVEGRKLLIKAVQTMMDEVNRDERIHPFLSKNPFTPWNVEIRVILRSPDGGDVAPGTLWGMHASEGFLNYKVINPATNRLTIVYKETYEEAIARLNDPSLPLVAFKRNPEISQDDWERLRKSISFVGDDGVIRHPN